MGELRTLPYQAQEDVRRVHLRKGAEPRRLVIASIRWELFCFKRPMPRFKLVSVDCNDVTKNTKSNPPGFIPVIPYRHLLSFANADNH